MSEMVVGRRLRRSLRLVTLGGCLCMVFIVGVMNPLQTEFFRTIGAREIHFGLIGGLPLAMMCMNFVGAVLVNRVIRRKPAFVVLAVLSRLLILPVAFLPWLLPSWEAGPLVGAIVALLSLSSLLAHLSPPFWFSWMADLIPARMLNRYWGHRQFNMMMVWVAGFLGVTLLTWLAMTPVLHLYPVLATVGVLAGVVDILLFLWVDEPPNQVLADVPVREVLLAPWRHVEFRRFLVFYCGWMFAIMFAASFMQLYLLKVLGLPLWQVTLIWCFSGIANGFAARVWGRLADRHGHKPIMLICGACKPLIVIVLLLVTPALAVPVLLPAFLLDGVWNAGNDIAVNGYMLKAAPRRNRSMFIAAMVGMSGICGGVGALAGGFFLDRCDGLQVVLAGREWNNYHLMFLISVFLRIICLLPLLRVKEPTSHSSIRVLSELKAMGPLRVFAFPVGLYRRLRPEALTEDRPADVHRP